MPLFLLLQQLLKQLQELFFLILFLLLNSCIQEFHKLWLLLLELGKLVRHALHPAEDGVDFAGVGWSNDIASIEAFMRKNCANYFKTVPELADFVI